MLLKVGLDIFQGLSFSLVFGGGGQTFGQDFLHKVQPKLAKFFLFNESSGQGHQDKDLLSKQRGAFPEIFLNYDFQFV